MKLKHLLVIHPIKMISGQNKDFIVGFQMIIRKMTTPGVRRPLKPSLIRNGLLGSQQSNCRTAEIIELVRIVDVVIQRSGIVLSEHKNLLNPGMERIGNGNVNQTVFHADGNRRFRPVTSERKK